MKRITNQLLFVCLLSISSMAGAFAQGGGSITPEGLDPNNHEISLKTLRALFPDKPVAVANELFGGLHAVADITTLLAIDDAKLQIGMLVWVANADGNNNGMYYRYIGDPNTTGNLNGAVADNWESLASLISDVNEEKLFAHTNNGTDDWSVNGGTLSATGEVIDNNNNTNAGDHLIITEDGRKDVYVFDGENSQWVLISQDITITSGGDISNPPVDPNVGDTVITNEGDIYIWDGNTWVITSKRNTVTENNSFTDYSDIGNYDVAANYTDNISGDIVTLKAVDGSYITYAFDGTNWIIIASSEVVVASGYKVYSSVDGASVAELDEFASLEALRSYIADATTTGNQHYWGITAGSSSIEVYYPAAWGNLSYTIVVGGYEFDVATGISITTVDANSVNSTDYSSGELMYKKITITCGNNNVRVR